MQRVQRELALLREEGVAKHKNSIVRPEQPYFTDAIQENPYFFNRCGYPFLCSSDLDWNLNSCS